MTIKRKIGRDEIEVSGTQEQCEDVIEKWVRSTKSAEVNIQIHEYVRKVAHARSLTGVSGGNCRSTLSLLQELLPVPEPTPNPTPTNPIAGQ